MGIHLNLTPAVAATDRETRVQALDMEPTPPRVTQSVRYRTLRRSDYH